MKDKDDKDSESIQKPSKKSKPRLKKESKLVPCLPQFTK